MAHFSIDGWERERRDGLTRKELAPATLDELSTFFVFLEQNESVSLNEALCGPQPHRLTIPKFLMCWIRVERVRLGIACLQT